MLFAAKAAVFMGAGKPFEIKEYPVVAAPAGYAGLSLLSSGVCGTDLHIRSGRLASGSPSIIGHEFLGRVEDVAPGTVAGDGNPLKKGDMALCYIACPCHKCPICGDGDDANCPNMGVTNGGDPEQAPHFWGGFAEYNFTPVANLAKVPSDLDPVAVSLFACAGPTSLHAFSLAERANIDIKKAGVAVVQGLGPVGLFAVWYLKSSGVKNVIAVTGRHNQRKFDIAAAYGADEVYALAESGEEGVSARVMELSGGLGADLCFEGSGSRSAFPFGMSVLRNRGVYLVPGQYSDRGKVEISPEIITFKALQILGSSQYSMCDIGAYLDFVSAHADMLPLMKDTVTQYRVQDINAAFADAEAGRNIKTVLTP
ncbi:MAG: alcohol dehydrogenase catalytic domain-containing protein [Clostridiales bacterium]|nr:alcohol dehydrogenase catalytic domain-containing protein [Clostridiales bacterium]